MPHFLICQTIYLSQGPCPASMNSMRQVLVLGKRWICVCSQLLMTIAAAAKSLQLCLTLCDPTDGSPPGSPSLGFSRQEHWNGLPFPSPVHESEK